MTRSTTIDEKLYWKIMNDLFPKVPEARGHAKYTKAHWHRMRIGMEMMFKYIDVQPHFQVVELGSKLPYFTALFPEYFGIKVHLQSIETVPQEIGSFIFEKVNMCLDDFGENKWDIVITTEIWEHLVCNLYDVRDRVLKSIKPGGYWLTSFPLGGKNAGNYEKILKNNLNQLYHPHAREFTEKTAENFMNIPNIKILATEKRKIGGYGNFIRTFLAQIQPKI